MNHIRVLRATNGLLIFIGYQVHFFDGKTQRYRLSPWAIGHFTLMSVFYLIAFTHHFENSALLHLLQDVSPFLRRLIRLQLVLGLKIFLLGIYELHKVVRAANELVTILPRVFAKKFSREEAYAYFLNYSTLFISLIIVFYVAYEMNFELPPLDNILIFCGLFIPHFMLSGALKLYNIGIWLQREQLLGFQAELERILPDEIDQHTDKALVMLESGNKVNTPDVGVTNSETDFPKNTNLELNVSLQSLHKQLEQLVNTAAIFNATLQRQLLLLVVLNFHCLLTGTYARVYYESTWHVVFLRHTKHVFQATNCGIFILIFWDYLTLGLTQLLFENVRETLSKRVHKAMKQRQHFTEGILTDMHELLHKSFSFKVLNMLRWNLGSFVLLHIFLGLIISLIVIYYYLDDQILALSERFDSNDSQEK